MLLVSDSISCKQRSMAVTSLFKVFPLFQELETLSQAHMGACFSYLEVVMDKSLVNIVYISIHIQTSSIYLLKSSVF